MSSSSSSYQNHVNSLQTKTKLVHQYYALRHGQSKANVAKIISSDPQISTIEHGLTDAGKSQVLSSAINFCEDYNKLYRSTDCDADAKLPSIAIYSSDFTRARETACIFAKVLNEKNVPLLFKGGTSSGGDDKQDDDALTLGVKYEVRLRERFFGQFNGQSDSHYQDVWDVDCINPDHTEFGVESVNSVVSRTSELVLDIEKKLRGCDGESCKVILVAHGDVLQILQTAFLQVDGKVHRKLQHLETATVRELTLGN